MVEVNDPDNWVDDFDDWTDIPDEPDDPDESDNPYETDALIFQIVVLMIQ